MSTAVKCKHCDKTVTLPHYCTTARRVIEENHTNDFLTSALIGAVTNSALLGGLLGGDIIGGIVGDFLNGGSIDD